ncbi:MAG: VWA domain-containing protein [Candidatus Lokiarchaeota archaeon]
MIKLFVDLKDGLVDTVIISQNNANTLGVNSGDSVEVFNPDNSKSTITKVEVSERVLDFAGKFSKNILDKLEYHGVELVLKPIGGGGGVSKREQSTYPSTNSQTEPVKPISTPRQPRQPSQAPIPTSLPPKPKFLGTSPTKPPKPPEKSSDYFPPPKPASSYQSVHSSLPTQPTPPPQMKVPLSQSKQQVSAPVPPQTEQEVIEPYPNRTDVGQLQQQKNGIILNVQVSQNIEGGRVQLSQSLLQNLGLGQGMLIAWEDPLTRSMGSARIDQAQISGNIIKMSQDTKEETNIQSSQIVVYSTEPPIEKASELMLEVNSKPNLEGFCIVSPRTQHSLTIQTGDVLQFEDELTGAVGAVKVDISEDVPDNSIVVDSEILEASGVGSFEVKVSKNQRQIMPLQSVTLGISPVAGENMWEVISVARENINGLKNWLNNYVIFKGIKLRWNAVNIACSIIDCIPDLKGDILATITENTTLTLSPTGLIPFNAVLIIDISRSMMARDVYVTNIAPAIEGIKAAMESKEIQEFLKKFKEGIYIPRRISAAFAAVLFLSEKVGRGFGEKVSVIRFADEAQLLPFGDSYYMDSASGEKGLLEDAARLIVDRIGNAYGQATNMGKAMNMAYQVISEFEKINPNQPTMIVFLTDGQPTDGSEFFNTIQRFSEMNNIIIYIVGLGNPDDELMRRAAALCGGEYFKPEDAGELLIWYSKRARDLSVKLKAHK